MHRSIARVLPFSFVLLLLVGCGTAAVAPPSGNDPDAVLPSGLTLNVQLEGPQANGYGNGYGVVCLTATGTNVSLFRFRLGDEGTQDSATGEPTHTFARDGTHAHRITDGLSAASGPRAPSTLA